MDMSTGLRPIERGAGDATQPIPARTRGARLLRLVLGRVGSVVVSPYGIAFVLMMLFGFLSGKWPYGQWDAWMIWNLRAKFFLHDPASAFDPALRISHLDYPPLIPILVATGWRIFGETPLVPIVIHAALYAILIWQFKESLWRMVLVGLTTLYLASWQIADVPLSLFLLGACMAYQRERWLMMSICLSFAVMTKNEGLLMALVVMGTAIATHGSKPLRSLIVLSVSVSLVMAYKSMVGVENDVMGSTGMLDRVLDIDRYKLLALMLPAIFVIFYGPPALILLIGARREKVRPDYRVLAMLGLILAGYVAIYVITPNDLVWHVTNSFDRLIVHMMPALVLTFSNRLEDNKDMADLV